MQWPEFLKPIVVRRVVSPSMAPKLRPGQLILATKMFRKLRPGQVVIVAKNDKELIKRIERIEVEGEEERIFLIGDNLGSSIDSRQFGWLDKSHVVARVFKPNLAK
jgi:signal peptidase I